MHSRRERAGTLRRLTGPRGAIALDCDQLRPPVASLALGVLLGKLRRLLKRVGNPQIESGQTRPIAPKVE